MDKDELIKLAKEMADRLPFLRSQDDFSDFTETLTKFTVERALNAELEYHLETEALPNSRNGYCSKTMGKLNKQSSTIGKSFLN